ncbi:MAG: cobalamin B12-binding domain-containing protein [Candidatus Lindowbacteria bacterium]|nr:cobalamin B12-binding domain-containing protein [Candidatus Lindowbacteria bacterium]
MERADFRILLFRYHPYVRSKAESNPKIGAYCAKRLSLFPPLGLAYLAGVLKNAGYTQVKIIDAWAEELSETALLEAVEAYKPNLVGCTLWTTNLNDELSILEKIKQRLPGVIAAVGGPHLDVYPSECLERAEFIDYGVVGEGEETAVELLDVIRAGAESPGKIKGIVYRDSKEIVFTGPRPPVSNLDSLPYPDFSDLPMDRYYSEIEQAGAFIYIYSARGCPYRCRHCFNSRGRVYRAHSIDYTMDYIKFLKERYGLKQLSIWDETFTFDKRRTLLFCQRFKEEGIRLPYAVRTRIDRIDEEIIRALKDSGCYRIHYGVESGVQEVLDKMNRKMTLEQVRDIVALTKKHGLSVTANFMIGYIDESRETYDKTVKFIKELDPDHLNIFITTVLPGTDLYFEALERGILKQDVWREYALGKIASIDTRGLRLPGKDYSTDDLDRMLAQAYRQIYFRPRFMLRKLLALRSPKQIKRYLTPLAALFSASRNRSVKNNGED